MAEQIALFGLIVGIALLLSGIGFVILALIVLGAAATKESRPGDSTAHRAGGQLSRPRHGTPGSVTEDGARSVQPQPGGRLREHVQRALRPPGA